MSSTIQANHNQGPLRDSFEPAKAQQHCMRIMAGGPITGSRDSALELTDSRGTLFYFEFDYGN
jgi:hypothetical protein